METLHEAEQFLRNKKTGNGYYYMLINDDNFIGYDID